MVGRNDRKGRAANDRPYIGNWELRKVAIWGDMVYNEKTILEIGETDDLYRSFTAGGDSALLSG